MSNWHDEYVRRRQAEERLRRLPMYKEPPRHPTTVPIVILLVCVVLYFIAQYAR